MIDAADCVWLDDSRGAQNGDGTSVVARSPIAVVEQLDDDHAILTVNGETRASAPCAWKLLTEFNKKLPRLSSPSFYGPGWYGYIGFEFAGRFESLPRRTFHDGALPHLRLALFDEVIVLDHAEQRATIYHSPQLREVLDIPAREPLFDHWHYACESRAQDSDAPIEMSVRSSDARGPHVARVTRALEYIAAGDIYQVNLAHRLDLETNADPLTVHQKIRAANPAQYAAYLSSTHGAISSASPELFLRATDDRVITRPIKGTRPRSGVSHFDAIRLRELLDSPKERAELAMIIDLHRNDIGRVCQPGSVRVVDDRCVEAHPSVFHTVAEIAGTLRDDVTHFDLIRAAFPAGSISGVPKIRALQIIHELETAPRGVYTGAIGYIGLNRCSCLNVAIRTVQFDASGPHLHVGGGIVADSDPDAEFDETLAKAAGILRAADATTPIPR